MRIARLRRATDVEPSVPRKARRNRRMRMLKSARRAVRQILRMLNPDKKLTFKAEVGAVKSEDEEI